MKRLLLTLVILATFSLIKAQIISHWTFTEMSGTSLVDHSGNSLNGQIYGATWQQVNGLRCLSFDGSGNYVSVPHDSKFNIGKGDFTIQAQFRTSVIPTGSFSCIFSKHNTANWYDTDISLFIEGGTGKPLLQLCDGTSNIPSNIENCYATTNVCDGKFHTVQVVRKDGQIKIYVDDNLEGSLASQINPDSSNPVNIGRTSYNNGYGYFNGVISQVSLWNTAISNEISHWTFTEMTGTILNDHSGNNNNGQIYGATWQQTNGLRSLLFNGSNNYVSVQNSSIYNLGTSDFTVAAQFKTSVVPTGSWVALVSKHNTANWHDREFNLSIEGGTGLPYFSLSDGSGYFETVKGVTNICDGLFHTVRGVRQSRQIKIYVDGNLEGTASASINVSNSNPINIGRSSYNNGYGYFNGLISEVSIWNTASPITSVENKVTGVYYDFRLFQNFPNPFNPTTTIKFSISKSQFVSIKVYDILGKEISTLVNEGKTPSSYEVQFNGSNLASGMYFYRMQAGSFSQTKKLLLIK